MGTLPDMWSWRRAGVCVARTLRKNEDDAVPRAHLARTLSACCQQNEIPLDLQEVEDMTQLVATFSYSPGLGSMISIAPKGDDYNAVAESHPAAHANPLNQLRKLGYRLAHQEQAYTSLRDTMAATGYAKLAVKKV